jgi:mannobiose 2-epimerase
VKEQLEAFAKELNEELISILEPYTNLYRVWKNEGLEVQIKKLIRTFLDHIIDQHTGHFNLFFEKDWTIKAGVISYGHDIEGAWLLTEAAEAIGDMELLREVEHAALKMTDASIKEGTDADGSLFYEREGAGGVLDSDKHWWPQAEAMVGLINAYQLSGDEKYLRKSRDVWHFIKHSLLDKKNGEWFWRVDKNGVVGEDNDKAGSWKCPYHNSRACMEAVSRINLLLQS